MKKPFVILWLLGILAFCLPASYLSNLNTNTYSNDYAILVPSVAIGVFIILGAISWLVYYIMKRRKRSTATRDALILFTSLVLLGTFGQLPDAGRKMNARNRFLNRENDRKEYMEGCLKSARTGMLPMLQDEVEDPEKAIEQYCACTYDKMELDPEVSDMLDGGVNAEEFQNHPQVKKIISDCVYELLDQPLTEQNDSSAYASDTLY